MAPPLPHSWTERQAKEDQVTWKARSRDAGRIAATPMSDNIPTPDRFEGRVLAVDPQHGSFLLGTDAGMIALRADPEDLNEPELGQTIEVQRVFDESPDDLTSPRSGA